VLRSGSQPSFTVTVLTQRPPTTDYARVLHPKRDTDKRSATMPATPDPTRDELAPAATELNPQPFPPRRIIAAEAVELNPKPLPPDPGPIERDFFDGDIAELNPKPLPPEPHPAELNAIDGEIAELNPKPLPPVGPPEPEPLG
jgi:hypothetical protein